MRLQVFGAVLALSFIVFHAFGQNVAISGAGYTPPGTLVVTPGQLLTIYVAGIGTGITQKVDAASTAPYQAGRHLGLLVVATFTSTCPGSLAFCVSSRNMHSGGTVSAVFDAHRDYTADTIYELYVYDGGLGTVVWASLLVTYGNAAGEIDLYGIERNPHIIHFGDNHAAGANGRRRSCRSR